MCKFRDLTADEIDVRVSTCSEKGISLLLYKDARVDMNILDETFGVTGWQRTHELIGDRLYCTVSIYDKDKSMWISKQDVGTESYTEKEKGQASDSFKRACFNIGIGRELYTAPFIWVSADKIEMKQFNGKWTTNERFEVADIKIDNKRITGLSIRSTKSKAIVYTYGACGAKTGKNGGNTAKQAASAPAEVMCPRCGKPVQGVKRPDGTSATPQEVLKGCGGICYTCYQAAKAAYQNVGG